LLLQGTAYLVVGVICLVLAFAFALKHYFSPRYLSCADAALSFCRSISGPLTLTWSPACSKLGDTRYLVWKNEKSK
jgi:hypothetical protein